MLWTGLTICVVSINCVNYSQEKQYWKLHFLKMSRWYVDGQCFYFIPNCITKIEKKKQTTTKQNNIISWIIKYIFIVIFSKQSMLK